MGGLDVSVSAAWLSRGSAEIRNRRQQRDRMGEGRVFIVLTFVASGMSWFEHIRAANLIIGRIIPGWFQGWRMDSQKLLKQLTNIIRSCPTSLKRCVNEMWFRFCARGE